MASSSVGNSSVNNPSQSIQAKFLPDDLLVKVFKRMDPISLQQLGWTRKGWDTVVAQETALQNVQRIEAFIDFILRELSTQKSDIEGKTLFPKAKSEEVARLIEELSNKRETLRNREALETWLLDLSWESKEGHYSIELSQEVRQCVAESKPSQQSQMPEILISHFDEKKSQCDEELKALGERVKRLDELIQIFEGELAFAKSAMKEPFFTIKRAEREAVNKSIESRLIDQLSALEPEILDALTHKYYASAFIRHFNGRLLPAVIAIVKEALKSGSPQDVLKTIREEGLVNLTSDQFNKGLVSSEINQLFSGAKNFSIIKEDCVSHWFETCNSPEKVRALSEKPVESAEAFLKAIELEPVLLSSACEYILRKIELEIREGALVDFASLPFLKDPVFSRLHGSYEYTRLTLKMSSRLLLAQIEKLSDESLGDVTLKVLMHLSQFGFLHRSSEILERIPDKYLQNARVIFAYKCSIFGDSQSSSKRYLDYLRDDDRPLGWISVDSAIGMGVSIDDLSEVALKRKYQKKDADLFQRGIVRIAHHWVEKGRSDRAKELLEYLTPPFEARALGPIGRCEFIEGKQAVGIELCEQAFKQAKADEKVSLAESIVHAELFEELLQSESLIAVDKASLSLALYRNTHTEMHLKSATKLLLSEKHLRDQGRLIQEILDEWFALKRDGVVKSVVQKIKARLDLDIDGKLIDDLDIKLLKCLVEGRQIDEIKEMAPKMTWSYQVVDLIGQLLSNLLPHNIVQAAEIAKLTNIGFSEIAAVWEQIMADWKSQGDAVLEEKHLDLKTLLEIMVSIEPHMHDWNCHLNLRYLLNQLMDKCDCDEAVALYEGMSERFKSVAYSALLSYHWKNPTLFDKVPAPDCFTSRWIVESPNLGSMPEILKFIQHLPAEDHSYCSESALLGFEELIEEAGPEDLAAAVKIFELIQEPSRQLLSIKERIDTLMAG